VTSVLHWFWHCTEKSALSKTPLQLISERCDLSDEKLNTMIRKNRLQHDYYKNTKKVQENKLL
jgi:hypothetical protein